jgi:DNA-binding transcriptional LysR family regulator
MRLNIKQVEAFYRVFVTGSVTAAAQQLYVSQPAVSRLVAELELAVNLKLFERKNRRLLPTPEGSMLFDEIEKTFVGLERISSRADEIRSFRSGSIRIAAMPALAYSVLPSVIKGFNVRHPGIHVSLNILNSESVFDWLSGHQMDFGIAALTSQTTLARIELLPSPACCCVVPAESQLAQKDLVTPQDLKDVPFISLPASAMLRRRVDEVFQASGASRQMVLETTYSLSAIQLVKLGLGVTIVDPFSAHYLADESVAVKPFVPTIPYEFGLVYPKSTTLSLAAQTFLAMLKMTIQELAGSS